MKIWNFFKRKVETLPQYKVVRYHRGAVELYLIRVRTGFLSWEYLMDHQTIGADEVCYRKYFNTQDEAVSYIEHLMSEREMEKVELEIIKAI